MKNGINKVTLMGHVGDDPKILETKESIKVTHFPLATSEYWNDKEGKENQRTEWHKVVVWRKKAEVAKKYIKKGDPLYVEGKIHTSMYEDKEGNKKYFTEIHCDNFLFISSKNSE